MKELWSDFDGTAVGLKGKTDPRNWTKYPLPLKQGYANFLNGVHTSGVDIAGIVSRRPDIWPRRFVTHRSIAKLGLENYFNDTNVILAGSEFLKAQHVVARASNKQVGIIDDKPHHVGVELVKTLILTESSERVTLGVVNHEESIRYVNRLREAVNKMTGVEVDTTLDGKFDIAIGRAVIRVVEMLPYSFESGQHFAEKIY